MRGRTEAIMAWPFTALFMASVTLLYSCFRISTYTHIKTWWHHDTMKHMRDESGSPIDVHWQSSF